MNRITKYEWQILTLFLFGLLINCSFFNMTILTMIVFFSLGLLFEFITEPLWDYNPELKKSPLTLASKDINFLFGLGWLALVILSLSVGKYLECWIPSSIVSAIIGFFIIGNIFESLYHYFGLWKYNKTHPLLRFPPIIGKYFELWNIPLSVRLGYTIMGIVAYYVFVIVQKFL